MSCVWHLKTSYLSATIGPIKLANQSGKAKCTDYIHYITPTHCCRILVSTTIHLLTSCPNNVRFVSAHNLSVHSTCLVVGYNYYYIITLLMTNTSTHTLSSKMHKFALSSIYLLFINVNVCPFGYSLHICRQCATPLVSTSIDCPRMTVYHLVHNLTRSA